MRKRTGVCEEGKEDWSVRKEKRTGVCEEGKEDWSV